MLDIDAWEKLKNKGSQHYKEGGTEPIDLYLSSGMFDDFALCSIIKYAFRSRLNMQLDDITFNANMNKIIHYAELLKAKYSIKEEAK